MTCYDLLLKNADRKNQKIVFDNTELTITELIETIDSFATSLDILNIKENDVVTMYLPTCIQAVVCFYACSKIGAICNIVHPLIPMDKLVENVIKTNSKAVLFYDYLIEDYEKLKSTNKILINCSIEDYSGILKPIYHLYLKFKKKNFRNCNKYFKMIKTPKKIFNTLKDSSSKVCVSMHSGGTTSSDKIVYLTNENFNSLSTNLELMYERKERFDEYSIACLPIFHAYGLGVSIHTCLTNKYSVILVSKFNTNKIIRYINNYNVTFIAGVPMMFKKLLQNKKFDNPAIQKLCDIWCGGDVVDESLVKSFDEVLQKHNAKARMMRGYGLTETTSVCAVNRFNLYKKESCGKAIPNTQLEIWDENNLQVAKNVLGEIVVSSDSCMKSYMDDCGYVIKNGKKYIKTGDIGYLDDEDYLFVKDRIKRVVKINAINIYPSEIENLIKTNKVVSECCVVPYFENNKTLFKAYLQLKEPKINEEDLISKLNKLCKSNLIKYAIPSKYEIVEKMPRTLFAKIDFMNLKNKQ